MSVLISLTACMEQTLKPDSASSNIVVLNNTALNIDRIKSETVTIDAKKPWQNSRVFIESGNVVHVSASGKWSVWPEILQWSGPEGTSMWQRRGMPGGVLIAKLGHDGKPFEVGVTRTFRAQDYGMLYFMSNDLEKDLFNNAGEVTAEVYIGGTRLQTNKQASSVKIVAYNYNDMTRRGSLSASALSADQFELRNYMLNKIGEITSSKNVGIKVGNEPPKGGVYTVQDESFAGDVMTIEFKAEY